MNRKKIISFVAAINLALVTLASCGHEIKDNEGIKEIQTNTTAPVDSQPDESQDSKVIDVEEANITASPVKYVKYSKRIEAENGTLNGDAKSDTQREGFKGEGYVTGLKTDKDSVEVSFDLTDTQYYNITLKIASDSECKNMLVVNGENVGEFSANGSKEFETITVENLYLEKGKANIAIQVIDGKVDVDFIKMSSNKEISDLTFNLKKSSLVNTNANYNTKALYKYICDNFGKKVILGQHDSVGTLTETNKIYELTGQYPAIRFGDLMPFSQESTMIGETEIQHAKTWASNGGIVSYMWHWTDPLGSDEYYSDKTDFDLSKAVTKENIATMSIEEIKKLNKKGKVSDECVAIIEDIDKVSKPLLQLQEEGIPVLWRPLHEASNGYFWWGKDAESYEWLWKLLYERQTNYHKLNNLVWVWSAQNAKWYVGDNYCDVLSVDIYDQGNLTGQINRFLFLYKICKTKPIVMSECGNFPTIQSIADQNAMWSYIGQWGGNFLLNEDGTINENYNTTDSLIQMYNNNLSISREKLPDFAKIAEKLESNDKAVAKENESNSTDDSSKTDDSKKDDSSSKS